MKGHICFYIQSILKQGGGIQYSEADKLPGKEMELSIFHLWQKQLTEQSCLIGFVFVFLMLEKKLGKIKRQTWNVTHKWTNTFKSMCWQDIWFLTFEEENH